MRSITSGSIACGFHAGDPSVMRATVRLAGRAGVAIGAHPGFADLTGFGRREINADPSEITDLVLYQVGALSAIAQAEGLRLQHVKPHGALYNMSVRRKDVAEAIARAVASFDDALVMVGLPGSELLAAAAALGLRVAAEGFADRAYEADGSLTPRDVSDAVLTDPGCHRRSRRADCPRRTGRRARWFRFDHARRYDLCSRGYARVGRHRRCGPFGFGKGGGHCYAAHLER